MNDLIRFLLTVAIFVMVAILGYLTFKGIGDSENYIRKEGKQVVVDGDTLVIEEWLRYKNLYRLNNGLVYSLE